MGDVLLNTIRKYNKATNVNIKTRKFVGTSDAFGLIIMIPPKSFSIRTNVEPNVCYTN